MEEVEALLRGQDPTFFRELAAGDPSPEEVTRLGAGGLFAVGRRFQELRESGAAERFYRAALEEEPSPWREWALLELTALLAERPDYRETVELLGGEEAALRYPALAHRLGTALYETDRYGELLRFIEAYRAAGRRDVAEPFDAPDLPEEMLIWESVARHQTGDIPGALEAAEELFLYAPLSERQQRLRLYFAYYDLHGELPPAVAEIGRGRVALQEGRRREAAELLRRSDPSLFGRESLYDAYRAFRAASYYTAGLEFFEGGLGEGAESERSRENRRFPLEFRDRASYYAGVLAIQSGQRQRAYGHFAEGLREGGSFPKEFLWTQYLRTAAYLGSERLELALPELTALARREPALRPALEEAIYYLTARGGPAGSGAGEAILRRGDAGSAAQVAVLAAAGIWDDLPVARRDLLAAQEQRGELFYRFLAYALLSPADRLPTEELLLLQGEERILSASVEPVSLEAGDNNDVREGSLPEPLTEGVYNRLRELGLYEELYELGLAYGDALASESVELAGAALQAVDRYYESLRLMHHAGYPEELGSRRRGELFYPRAFDAFVLGAAAREGLDPAFWYGVIREESFFSSSVASHAGAVGLSQLMPATAADVAERMGLSDPELTDPETNLAIGSWYLRNLRERFELPVAALAAYNAGQGRVRRWLAAEPESALHFHQRIPFRETRNHVRKVLVSAVYYNYLYFDISPIETIRFFFPELEEQGV